MGQDMTSHGKRPSMGLQIKVHNWTVICQSLINLSYHTIDILDQCSIFACHHYLLHVQVLQETYME